MAGKSHWESVYADKAPDAVSWFEAEPTLSLQRIAAAGLQPDDPLIDVGGGASRLVDRLLALGFSKLTVLDLAGSALAAARDRLGDDATRIDWIEADITHAQLPSARYALWHDRAVFHFLTDAVDRDAYRLRLLDALRPNGQLLISTFADDGPERCSGLPIVRYSEQSLQQALGPGFERVWHGRHRHRTPWDSEQSFVTLHLRRVG